MKLPMNQVRLTLSNIQIELPRINEDRKSVVNCNIRVTALQHEIWTTIHIHEKGGRYTESELSWKGKQPIFFSGIPELKPILDKIYSITDAIMIHYNPAEGRVIVEIPECLPEVKYHLPIKKPYTRIKRHTDFGTDEIDMRDDVVEEEWDENGNCRYVTCNMKWDGVPFMEDIEADVNLHATTIYFDQEIRENPHLLPDFRDVEFKHFDSRH